MRPTLLARVAGHRDTAVSERFLIDTGADRTVFSAMLLSRLNLPASGSPTNVALVGIGGHSAYLVLTTVLEVAHDTGTVRIRGEFAAFTDPLATDLSILGRDALDHFDLILSRRRDEVLMLSGTHGYRVTQA